jgi:hypothetical protein
MAHACTASTPDPLDATRSSAHPPMRNGWTTVAPAAGASVDILSGPFETTAGAAADCAAAGSGTSPTMQASRQRTSEDRRTGSLRESDERASVSRAAAAIHEGNAQ